MKELKTTKDTIYIGMLYVRRQLNVTAVMIQRTIHT